MKRMESIIVLLSITFCWSSSYIFIKDISQSFSTYAYLALTSGLAGIALSIVFFRMYRKLNRKTLLHGIILGLLISGNIVFEKLALDHLPASSVSALASMNILLVPLILLFRKQYPSRNNLAGFVIILSGLFVSGNFTSLQTNPLGILYIFISCLMMSFYTVLAADFTQESDPLFLTILQLLISGLLGLVICLITEPGALRVTDWNLQTFSYIVIIAFFSKAYAYIMLMYAEKYADAIIVTIVAATDPVVTLFLALVIPSVAGNSELFSPKSLAGALIIALGAIVAGTTFLSRKEKGSVSGNEDLSADSALSDSAPANFAAEVARKAGITPLLRPLALILILFALLGLSVNVMEFSEGYSELRPENFIPVPAGLLFGPLGGIVCAIGNLIQDLPFDYGYTSIFGIIGNFMAAYLPYKLWNSISRNNMHTHTVKNIILYIWAALLSSLCCSFILTSGLTIIGNEWYSTLFYGSALNIFLFSVAFGLPVFIVATSADSKLEPVYQSFRPRCGLRVLERFSGVSRWFYLADTILLAGCLICDTRGLYWSNSIFSQVLSIVTLVVVIISCLIPC